MEMSSSIVVVIVAVVAVGLFVLGLSLTLIFKGHHIDSEIGDNKHMKERGIDCAKREFLREEQALRGEDGCDQPGDGCDPGGCGTCASPKH